MSNSKTGKIPHKTIVRPEGRRPYYKTVWRNPSSTNAPSHQSLTEINPYATFIETYDISKDRAELVSFLSDYVDTPIDEMPAWLSQVKTSHIEEWSEALDEADEGKTFNQQLDSIVLRYGQDIPDGGFEILKRMEANKSSRSYDNLEGWTIELCLTTRHGESVGISGKLPLPSDQEGFKKLKELTQEIPSDDTWSISGDDASSYIWFDIRKHEPDTDKWEYIEVCPDAVSMTGQTESGWSAENWSMDSFAPDEHGL